MNLAHGDPMNEIRRASVDRHPLAAGNALKSAGGDIAIGRGTDAEVLVFDLSDRRPAR
jgi:hypothetical protein